MIRISNQGEKMEDIPQKVIEEVLKKASKKGYRKESKLPEKAFALGVQVGYYGHMDGVGWVLNQRDMLLDAASKYGLQKILIYYYEKGKDFGKERRTSGDLGGTGKGSGPEDDGSLMFKEEEFEIKDVVNLTSSPQLEELFKPLEVLPGASMPKMFRLSRLLK